MQPAQHGWPHVPHDGCLIWQALICGLQAATTPASGRSRRVCGDSLASSAAKGSSERGPGEAAGAAARAEVSAEEERERAALAGVRSWLSRELREGNASGVEVE